MTQILENEFWIHPRKRHNMAKCRLINVWNIWPLSEFLVYSPYFCQRPLKTHYFYIYIEKYNNREVASSWGSLLWKNQFLTRFGLCGRGFLNPRLRFELGKKSFPLENSVVIGIKFLSIKWIFGEKIGKLLIWLKNNFFVVYFLAQENKGTEKNLN